MKISTALILSAGLGKRLNPLTLTTPKPLLELDNITILERCINIIIKLGAKKIFLNTFHLSNQIFKFIENKKFPIDIQIIKDGKEILNTGGGILNMVKHSEDKDFIIFNPDTLWHEYYIEEINKMQDLYFSKKLNNVLLLANKKLSFDQTFRGDFNLKNNLLKINENNNFIYIGCQILNRELLENHKIHNFPISEVWSDLLKNNKLNGFESSNKFYHLTNLEIFKKLKDL
jgi:MurNAc alpha-1-phosphate uridylyltransferase